MVAFIKQNYASFSREGLRYAIEKMKDPLRKQLMNYEVGASKRVSTDVHSDDGQIESDVKAPTKRSKRQKK